jgi:glycosyltransferase involved in cell wall biosynthesis
VKSLKVAVISEEFPPFMFGGIGSACYDYALALSRKGIKTTVLCGKSRTMNKEQVNENLEVIRLPCLELPPRFFWFQLQNLKFFRKQLEDYSVIHIFNPQAGAAIALLSKQLRKPLLTSIHGLHLTSLKLSLSSPQDSPFKDIAFQIAGYPLQTLLHQACLKNSDHIAVCNYSTLAELNKMFRFIDPTKTSVIYNGINFDFIESIVSKEEYDGPIVYCGRLYWAKGATYFVKALSKLKSMGKVFRAEIFGEGPLKHKLLTMISELGLTTDVSVRGFISRKELFEEFGKASMVVLPSLYEAQPVTLLEAMACKKPTIAFDLPFAREIITTGFNGFLAKVGNVDDLAHKMKLLLEDKDLRTKLGNNAYVNVKKNHDWQVLCEKYLQIYEKIAK